ncbi:hypothetical protein HDIA_P0041 (plasmid) [Hartmannibacter diazotrophicus]|uniref:Helix-turn-helix domain protein n=2 Tax=Hartmannibacter diazotrophicus TaxID=1482074 RepID=A0A2C9DE33_9HYPH|nr:hypothetical protein HDIA_P0041 [Hartmannibacter diazotrophicus]
MEICALFSWLAEPMRQEVVPALAAALSQIRLCESFDLPVTKAARTYHFRFLHESGLISQVDTGNGRTNVLHIYGL